MELQSRPEALALELARPQNGDLSKLHERQPRIAALSDKQALGTVSAVPGVGLPVSSLQRLAGHGAAVLPQVRPKTLIPDSLPVAPGRERPPKQPPAFPKGTVVSIKNPSPALPTANNTVSHGSAPAGQPQALAEPAAVGCPLSGAGVAYAIISSTPSNAAAAAVAPGSAVAVLRDGLKVQPLLISTDSKVIILQPQVQTQPEGSAQPRPPSDEPPQGAPDEQPPGQETPEKLAFMVALGLVTTEHLEEIQSKRQERKRRSTANPAYSGLLETERKRLAPGCLGTPLSLTARANEEPCWKSELAHDEHCAVCKRGADLQPCSTCPGSYHLSCLEPPVRTGPKGLWKCPKCQQKALKDEGVPWSGMLAAVHSYVTHKTVKEEEKQKLLQRGGELHAERQQLEARDRRLASAVKKCLELKSSLLARQRGAQSTLGRLRALLRLIRGTVTSASPAPLLPTAWTKPATLPVHSVLPHPPGHN
ncbi:PHD finger protein 21B isoform X2 [Sorex fumeus]|uniref:PHD finger protein 21B isoform X2 n=1 Tax=Sorex fumeus TaxID=62283 RepID=UPI0024AE6ECC|nr:PHD finger protein 21B isoform X2 [Sorex fumeus]